MSSERNLTRRSVLKLGVAAGCSLAFGGCISSSSGPSGPEIEELRGFNVHPYPGPLMPVQMRAINDMRINWVRMTLGILTDSAGPYVNALRANILGLIADFNLGPINKNDWPAMVETVIRRYPSIQYFQILNEPKGFNDMSYTEYVLEYLKPAHKLIRAKFPYVKIVCAAPGGQPGGINDFRTMSAAGADEYCDFRAVHIYYEQGLVSPWSAYRTATQKPMMITETGEGHHEHQLNWWQTKIPEMKRLLKTEFVFYYVLLDQPVYTGYEIITGELDHKGNIIPAPGSELYNFLRS
jgi:hypothetical protein